MAIPKTALTLYLSPWQKRMMRDFMGPGSFKKLRLARISKLVIKYPRRWCLASYKIPMKGIRRDDWVLYLTDTQMVQVQEIMKTRIPITSINISKEFIDKGQIAFM